MQGECEHYFGVARCRYCGEARPLEHTEYPAPPPVEPWEETVRVVVPTPHPWAFRPLPEPVRGSTTERDEVRWWTTYLGPTHEQRRAILQSRRPGVSWPRAPLGERDRDFTNMDLRTVQWLGDEWDHVMTRSGERVSEFHDLLGHMNEIPLDGRKTSEWNQNRDPETDRWVPAFWTHAGLAERLCRYDWNADFFCSKRIPESAWAGKVHEGRLVRFAEGEFGTVIAQWRKPRTTEWLFTVFWRESMGFEPITVRGKTIRARVWVYHYAKTFSGLGGRGVFDRQGALAFADRLTAKALLERDLEQDTLRSMGHEVAQDWNRDEYPYDPIVMVTMTEGQWADDPM